MIPAEDGSQIVVTGATLIESNTYSWEDAGSVTVEYTGDGEVYKWIVNGELEEGSRILTLTMRADSTVYPYLKLESGSTDPSIIDLGEVIMPFSASSNGEYTYDGSEDLGAYSMDALSLSGYGFQNGSVSVSTGVVTFTGMLSSDGGPFSGVLRVPCIVTDDGGSLFSLTLVLAVVGPIESAGGVQ